MTTPRLVTPTDAANRVIRAFGDEITVLLSGEDTGGAFTAFTDVTPPGGGPPPHFHDNEDEWFFPQEGRVEFFLEGAWREVPVGGAVFAPKGSVHTFRNIGDGPLTMLIHTAPAGFEVFFATSAEEFAKPEGPDMARLVEIAGEHGIHFVDAPE
ncbi:MAG: cupin domain-containing protein [Planctomycetota bacterium]|jgi:quercetin dioxygenase-like cupin family protein